MPLSIIALAIQFRWQLVASSILTYIGAVCLYRRFFHPLAKIPGPFLPAVTMLYQTAYNSQYYKQIALLHKKYGPVVRITPNEIHLSDPENYDKIYFVGSKYAKSANLYDAINIPSSTFGTVANDVHRIRRGAMNPMFSRKMVLELEPLVQDKALKVCKRMQEGIEQGLPVDLHHAFRAASVDVVSDFAFGKSYDFLEQEDFGLWFFRTIRGIGPGLWFFQQFPSLRAMTNIPPWLAQYLSETMAHLCNLQQECVNQVEDVKLRMAAEKYTSRQTIFSTLLTEDDKPAGYQIPSTLDLKDEALSILAAAADTTGNAMSVAAFHVMRNPQVYRSLVHELKAAFPNPNSEPPFVELERLPYLTAVIKEALRLSFGVINRLPRVVPAPGATFNGYYIPAGTIVGMSSWIMHQNPKIFPDPMKFQPERWLDLKRPRELERHMVPFGKGTRQCVGMPLAYCELYVIMGTFFRRFHDLKVFKTTPADMEYDDYFASYHVPGNWLKATA